MTAFTSASRRVLLIGSAAMMAACATKPDLGPKPELASPAQYETAKSFNQAQTAWPADQWWKGYGDAQLTRLIDEALKDSPSLAIAMARLRQAQAQAQQAGAPMKPSLGVEGSISTSRQEISLDNLPQIESALPDDWSTRGKAGATLQYQLDFFGRNRASFAAATSQAEAAAAEAAAARLQLSTAIALAYAEFARLNTDVEALQDAQKMRQASADLVQLRFKEGLENDGQVQQAASELAQTQADLIAAQGALARTRTQIAALLGKGPDRGLSITPPAASSLNSIGLPARVEMDLLGRRPDLVAARLRAQAAEHGITVARADFYPNVNLTAFAGFQTLGLDQLGGGNLTTLQFGPAISLPIFSGGKIEGAYRAARASYDEAVATYNQSLIEALREVADAINDRRTIDAQLERQSAALVAAEAAYRVARTRYDGGLISYIDTLSVENSVIQRRRAVADLKARALSSDVTLVRALGGGFQAS